jgi:cyanophycin synthetase
MTPGRMNLLRLGETRVLVDYAHNPAAIEGLIDFAMNLPATGRVAVVTAPGDRRDEDIRDAGRLAALFDRVIVKEDDDRRGRAPGEIAALVVEGLRERGVPDDRIDVIPSEHDAVERLMDVLGRGEVGVILADHVLAVLAQVHARATGSATV